MYGPISVSVVCCIFWLSIAGQTSQTGQKTISLDLKSFHNGQIFYTPMTVGRDNNEKTFRMLVATSQYMTWILSSEISPEYGYEDRTSVPHTHKQLWDIRHISPACYGSFKYHIHNDTWKVSSQLPPVNNQAFAVVDPAPGPHDGMIKEIDGKLGLNDGTSEPDNVDYLFKNLHKSNYIDHLMYSFYVNNTAVANRLTNNDDSQPEGALVLGGIDPKYYTGELKYAKMYDDLHVASYSNKSLYVSNIRLDWSRASEEKQDDSISRLGKFDIDMQPARLKLDSSVILYSGDKKMLDIIHSGIMKAYPILGQSLYAFKDCRLDNKPDIVFTIMNDINVTITPEDYVIGKEVDNSKVCVSAFRPNRGTFWEFGTKFMRKYYTVFDYENDRVGFATPAS